MNDSSKSTGDLRLTRITNACVLIELGDHAVLTDPWFENPWGFNEDPGIGVADLPKLTAIIGSHFAPDHWGIDALKNYPDRDELLVFTSTDGMASKARKLGFTAAKRLPWGETVGLAEGLTLEVVPAQTSFGKPSNNYLLSDSQQRVFFGGETKELEPLRAWRAANPPVDIALAPSNGMRLLGMQLVTTANEAFEAAEILGAKTLIPIHDSMHGMGFGGPTSHATELDSRTYDKPRVVFLEAGQQTAMSSEPA